MDPHDSEALDLVRQALLQPASQRMNWMRDRAGARARVLNAAERMLQDHESRTLIDPTVHDDPPSDQPASFPSIPPSSTHEAEPGPVPGLPERLGHYRITGLLGEGGMGVVYLARQDRPRRTVALKVIRPGLLSPRLLRRFEIETQTLARLQHPAIAQVYEAGTFPVGAGAEQPYFAMEYVDGRPLNDYAAAAGLTLDQRIRLFSAVCGAVQHAHQRGVIHRDLKSTNILVNADGEPKVLDFGVAKLADAGPDAAALRTDAGQVVGTVPYMSPEQIAGRPDEVDTRSDVYTLGVVLFELLSGRLPHPVGGRTIVEASRIIAGEDAPRLGALSAEFRGDLETIVAKSIDKDRDRRYQTPAELAADLQRYLEDQPILARPPSTVYQLRKFARRNQPVVVAAALGVAALLLGTAGIAWQAVEATRGRSLAERMRAAADEAKLAAIQESGRAKAINGLLTDMLQSADPDVSLGREVTVAEVLDRTAAVLATTVLDPHVLASIRSTLAATYQNLNQLAKAEEQARATVELTRTEFGEDAPETLDAVRSLGDVIADAGRFSEAEPLVRDVLARSERRWGVDAPQTVGPMISVSRVLHEAGKMQDANQFLDRALAVGMQTLGDRHPDTLYAMHNKASALKDEGRFNEAITMFERVVDLRREVFGPNHSQTLSSMNNLAGTLQKAGRNAEALRKLSEVYAIRRRIFGENHATTLTTLSNLAVCHVALKQPELAEPLMRRALDGYLLTVGESHNKALITMANLAFLEDDRGNTAEAERLFRRVIDIRTHGPDPNVPELLTVMNNLAMLLHEHGRSEEAVAVFADLIPRCEAALPAGNYVAAIFAGNYGECLIALGRYDQAEPLLRRSLADLEKSLGPAHDRTIKAAERLTRLAALRVP